jgi:predicted enzyme related to lactoylglutathione lyase
MVNGLGSMPILPVKDVAAMATWFETVLGFSHASIWDWEGKPNFSIQNLGKIAVACHRSADRAPKESWEAYFYVDDMRAFHARAVANGANVPHDPYETPYGMLEIEIITPEGHQLAFGQDIEAPGPD